MIRPARANELPLLSDLALRSKAVWGYTEDFLARCKEELTLRSDDLGRTYVKEVGSRAVGFYSLETIDTDRVELGHLFVEPSELRRGYGAALVRDACTRARAQGAKTLVIQGDPNSADFYLALGAVRVGERASDSIEGRLLPVFEVSLA